MYSNMLTFQSIPKLAHGRASITPCLINKNHHIGIIHFTLSHEALSEQIIVLLSKVSFSCERNCCIAKNGIQLTQ